MVTAAYLVVEGSAASLVAPQTPRHTARNRPFARAVRTAPGLVHTKLDRGLRCLAFAPARQHRERLAPLRAREERQVFPLMIARRRDRLHAYVNVCLHQFLPLDGYSGEFINPDDHHIMCIHHAAIFNVATGECAGGPCRDRTLLAVNIDIRDGEVLMGRWPDPPPRPEPGARAERRDPR